MENEIAGQMITEVETKGGTTTEEVISGVSGKTEGNPVVHSSPELHDLEIVPHQKHKKREIRKKGPKRKVCSY